MADTTQTFKILLQVVSQLGGLQQLTTGVQNTVRQFETINAQLSTLANNASRTPRVALARLIVEAVVISRHSPAEP